MKKTLRINKSDNVVIALNSIKKGEACLIGDTIITINEDVDFGHKIALMDIAKDASIIKYGEKIGFALQEIRKGEWVHKHNLYSNRGRIKGEENSTDEV